MAPSSSSSMTAEYAKSNRSSCKGCSKTIDSKTLRLGIVTKDPRGFEAIKWHHPSCFPLSFHLSSSPELSIKGFSSLQSTDQEAVKKLLAGQDNLQEKDDKATKDIENELQQTEASDPKKRKLNTSEAVVDINLSFSDVKSKYKDATLLPNWKAFQTVIFLERDDGLNDSSKIAAFDFDGCLAKTDVRRVGADAWSLMYPSIPDKLQSLYNDGFKLVIFTNESNIERWKNKRQAAVDSKIGRLNNFIETVKVPIQVFIACGIGKSGKGKAAIMEDDPFRKPKPGMWQLMEKHFNSSISIDMDQLSFLPFYSQMMLSYTSVLFFISKSITFSPEGMRLLNVDFVCCRSFYVGDAAGREKDHSDADIKFAEAIGLKFYVPEKFFEASDLVIGS